MKPSEYTVSRAVGDLSSQVWFITGGTGGIGRHMLLTLATLPHPPHCIYFTGRSQASADKVISEYSALMARHCTSPEGLRPEIIFLPVDLASFPSIKDATQAFVDKEKSSSSSRGNPIQLHRFIGNAGIMAVPPGQTKDGYEIQFGTNHMSHSLLIKLLLPYIESTPQSRIILVSSDAHTLPGKIRYAALKTPMESRIPGYAMAVRYTQSKLANIYYAQQLAQHHPEIMSVSLHPGVMRTGLQDGAGTGMRMMFDMMPGIGIVSIEDGVKNHFWTATVEAEALRNGGYYTPVGEFAATSKRLKDVKAAEELWEYTQKELEGWQLARP